MIPTRQFPIGPNPRKNGDLYGPQFREKAISLPREEFQKELVDKLKDNDSLDFHFVNSKEANKGLKDGDYYMVITIPSKFFKECKQLCWIKKILKKMVLNYTTNPGTNYVASKMDEFSNRKN